MGDKETEAHQQDKDVTEVQTRDIHADTNAAPDNKGDSQQEEPSRDGASVPSNEKAGVKPAVSPEETAKTNERLEPAENVASKKDFETIGSTSQVQSTTPNSDVPSSVEDDDKPDGASVPSNKESGVNPAVSPEETAKANGEGTLKSATENQECLPPKAPAAAEQTVSEKDVETIGPSPQVGPTPNSDALQKVEDDDKPDGASVPSNEESGVNPAVSPEETAKNNDEGTLKSATENQECLPPKAPAAAEQTVSEKDVETIGPSPQVGPTPNSDALQKVEDDDKPDEASVPSNEESGVNPAVSPEETAKASNRQRLFWLSVALVAIVAVLVSFFGPDKDPPQKTDLRQIDIFHREMENLKVKFPSQREELWKRSRIHLQRHFHISQPTEPVSIILTAGVRAEGTLRCLAQSIASALSSALNVSAFDLDGVSKSSQDSDKVKSDIDSQLQKAFEEGKPIAVIHRFEELPPASTLIFYRYCDHENAAFKKTFLIFTVLLGEEEEIQAKIRLSEVEEMVTDHLQKKFLSHGHPSAFDKMDIDKYGGLWSRISHLILPVATEKRIEKTHQC